MLWGDPWATVVMTEGGTSLPPPRTPLYGGQQFDCLRVDDIDMSQWVQWIDLVGTRWSIEEVLIRLKHGQAWIPCLRDVDGDLMATCVLWPKPNDLWILETLRARKGSSTPLLRAMIRWLYDRTAHEKQFTLGYTWELSVPGLVSAWWRGWLGSAATVQYGYSWSSDPKDCGFCPARGWEPIGPRMSLPSVFMDSSGSAVISDSGLGDGWGHMSVYSGAPDWSAIATKGGWRYLWLRTGSGRQPKGWSWTGEIVVVGLLGPNIHSLDWITAEIA